MSWISCILMQGGEKLYCELMLKWLQIEQRENNYCTTNACSGIRVQEVLVIKYSYDIPAS